jgi:hypothetical protein
MTISPPLGVQFNRKFSGFDPGAILDFHLPAAVDPNSPLQPGITPEPEAAVPVEREPICDPRENAGI